MTFRSNLGTSLLPGGEPSISNTTILTTIGVSGSVFLG